MRGYSAPEDPSPVLSGIEDGQKDERQLASRGIFWPSSELEKGKEEEESDRGKNVILPLFSLLNRLQPVRGVPWPNFTEPECLLAKCSKVGVR